MELVVESGPDAGKVFQIGQTMLVAGRQIGTDIQLNDDQISRRHASFEEVNNILLLNDLGSANGTRLNGRLIDANRPLSLSPGDRVQIGRTTLLVKEAPGVKEEPTLTGGERTITEFAGAFPANPPYASPVNADRAHNLADQFHPEPPAPAPYYQNPGYIAPDSPQPPSFPPNGPYVQPPPPSQAPPYYRNGPVMQPPVSKKSSQGPVLAGIAGILIVAIAAIGAILLISSANKPGPTPPATTGAETPVAIIPAMQAIAGPSGSNALPPPPPEATAGATPTPNAGGAGTQALGLSIVFPKDWETTVDEGQNTIESDGPDGVTSILVHRISGLKGTPTERLTLYLNSIQENIDSFKLIRPVQSTSSDNTIANAYITYAQKDGKLVLRDYIVATANTAGDTYFVHCVTDDSAFESQINTFNSTLKSIVIN
jgi:hypothetical protein